MMLLFSNKPFFKTVYNSEFLDNVNIPISKYTYYRGTSGIKTYITKLKALKQPDEININIDRYLSTLEKFEYNNEIYYYDKSNDFTIISYRNNNDDIGFMNTIYMTYCNGKVYSE